ncbi:leucyl aminopeptidase [Hasllibacter halocynthiae]|uniref:Probable cytosol aminopeptidase n=1 Tax=Hasllibacter halocynthiae TaxID=595589 RepID=A0A2T0X7P2_9RHOB|nr:leucyl aminopeptidase [Hasllibacter halocynthiae]PRY94958.1 leucyl aminopeptidase [Hasllibacter halocynthiae]
MTLPATPLAELTLTQTDLDGIEGREGVVAVLVGPEGKLDPGARRVDARAKKAVSRMVASEEGGKMKPGAVAALDFPAGMAAEAVLALRLDPKATQEEARKGGAALAKAAKGRAMTVLASSLRELEALAEGLWLGGYKFTASRGEAKKGPEPVALMAKDAGRDLSAARAVAEGVFLTRDLVNLPANVLTTTSFAERLEGLRDLGVEVEVLEEDRLAELGMRCLLAVGQGSESPSKVVTMRWNGGGDEAPLALVGKGVVFDTGGISLKPGAGMEDMTMDMGGAGTVAGVVHAVAARKAKANVVGLVGLVENMPDGRATRPGDVVRSMKGDTVEIINTDAEGRLVLCDVMWHAQEAYRPRGMIDLATLTGAVIVALGHENAGVFSNDDAFAGEFLRAAEAEGEGAWRLPMGPGYDEQLKSRFADMKNVGGRPAGSITAAQFLRRFVQEGVPWAHLDIAGTASQSKGTDLGPAGATGWGVRALDRMIGG